MKHKILWPVGMIRKVVEKRKPSQEKDANLFKLTLEDVEAELEHFSSSLRDMVPRYNEHWKKEE